MRTFLTVLLALTAAGTSRETAYDIVQRTAMRCWAGEGQFKDLLAADEALRQTLDPERLESCFKPERMLKHVDTVYRRVFGK